MRKWSTKSLPLFVVYVAVAGGMVALLLTVVGTDVMPVSNNGDFQISIQAPQGSRLEKTEKIVKEITAGISTLVPENSINLTSALVVMHPEIGNATGRARVWQEREI